MASDLGDGDYLGAYRRFFVDFLDKVNPEDQLPIKTSGHDVTEGEIVGEIIHMTLQYLNQELCPPSLQCYVVQLVIEEIKAICRKEPETCGYRHEEKTYAPLKLMQAITGKVNEICQRYLENSRLALLPPPPSTPMPLATAFAIKNTRRKMEDRHVILHDLNTIFNNKDDSVASYYAVFDGHAGYQAAVYCAAHLHQYLAESCHYPTDPERALRDAFLTTDALFIQKSTRQTLSSGTTAVCALILNKKLYVAWAGDSQAALAKRGAVTQLVNPHKPDRNDERERVEEMGGTVMHLGIWRVNGNLAVSRAIGDAQYKPYVTGDPEIRCITLDGHEDFLIIACDGLWDCVTEDEAAALVYREIYRHPYDYDSISQRLVEYSKAQGSIDNITVIVVFLTAPIKIASRPPYGNPLLADVQLDNMEPDNRFMSNANGQFDVNSPFVKQPTAKDSSPDSMDVENPYGSFGNKSSNGMRHENGGGVGIPVADYDAEEDDEDLGPETDVDALDDVSEPEPTLADVSRQLFPEKQNPCEVYQADEGMDEDSSPSSQAKKTNQQALIPDADNVADSEDSEDEWNYYRIDPNKEKNSTGAAGLSPSPKKDSEPVEYAVVSSSPSDHGDRLDIEKERESANNDTDSSSDEDSEREIRSFVLVNTEISANKVDSNPATETTALPETEGKDNQQEQKVENTPQEEDMDFQLNPNAAEFVPVSPTPIIPSRTDLDAPIAGSPLKQIPLMDDMRIPSHREFQNEVRHRPGEIEEKTSTNGRFLAELEECSTEKSEAAPCTNALDESEVSSTKAEYGDESSFLTASEFHRTGGSNFDGSFTEPYGGFDESSIDPMTKSFGPGDFMNLSNPVDLNAVHDLTDADLMTEENGTQENPSSDKIELNVEVTESKAESEQCSPAKADLQAENESGNIMNPSSPVSSLHANELHHDVSTFENENDSRNHSVQDRSISDIFGASYAEQKNIIDSTVGGSEIEQPAVQQTAVIDQYDETNVSSKLLEMDLEDRGSQDCEFEKCNEKLRVESSATSELSDFVSSPATEEDLVDPCMPESFPISSTNAVESSQPAEIADEPEVEKLAESFNDLRADDQFSSEITSAPDVPFHNPLDLNVESASHISEGNLVIEESPATDYIVAKVPESPGVAVSPLVEERSNNPFTSEQSSDHVPASNFDFQAFEEIQSRDEPIIQAFERHMEILNNEKSNVDMLGKFEEIPQKVESQIMDFENHDDILQSEKSEKHEIPLNIEEPANVSTGLKLSESLQEFTGLEQQLDPGKVTNGIVHEDNLLDINNEESQKIDFVLNGTSPIIEEPIAEKDVEKDTTKEQITLGEESKAVEPASTVEKASVVAAAAVATAAIAGTVAAPAAKTTKAKPTAKIAPKTVAATKTATNKSTPTSPTKPAGTAARGTTAAVPKKAAAGASAAARPNKLETGTKPAPTSAPGSKATAATKSTLGVQKTTTARLSAASPRTKLASTTITAKTTTTLGEKKPTSNGDAKSTASAATKTGAATARVPSKTLVKSTTTSARAPIASAANGKPKVSLTSTTTNKVPIKSTTGTVGTTTQRPKTAPVGGATTIAAKSRLTSATGNSTSAATAKSTITEKHIKETANKQISSSRTKTTTTASKTSRTSVTSSTTATTRRVGAAKTTSTTATTTTTAVPPPIRKPAAISRLGAKTAAANAKTNATKTTSTTAAKTKVIVENGVCTTAQETKIVTSTTETINNDSNEEDVPKKDLSPVELPTDNQLIITAD